MLIAHTELLLQIINGYGGGGGNFKTLQNIFIKSQMP